MQLMPRMNQMLQSSKCKPVKMEEYGMNFLLRMMKEYRIELWLGVSYTFQCLEYRLMAMEYWMA
jgi:hypothetical protein